MKKTILILGILCLSIIYSSAQQVPASIDIMKQTKELRENPYYYWQHAQTINYAYKQNNSKATPQYLDSVEIDYQSHIILLEYRYDATDRLEQEQYSMINLGIKYPIWKLDYYYSPTNKAIKKVGFEKETPFHPWDSAAIINLQYNANDLVTSEIIVEWDDTLGSWQPENKTIYSYDGSGNLIYVCNSEWDSLGAAWVYEDSITYGYAGSGSLIEGYYYEWNTLSSAWEEDEYIANYYNGSGYKTSYIEYYHNGTTWEEDYKLGFSYNVLNKIDIAQEYNWNSGTSSWDVGDYKTELSYNAAGDMTQALGLLYNDSSLVWENRDKSEQTYDTSYSFNDMVIPIDCYSFYFILRYPHRIHPYYNLEHVRPWFDHMMLSRDIAWWDGHSSSWDYERRETYYYSDHTASINENTAANITVFPNPVSDILHIKLDIDVQMQGFVLYDLTGRKIMDIRGKHSSINMENIAEGIYIYTIDTDKGIFGGKLSIVK